MGVDLLTRGGPALESGSICGGVAALCRCGGSGPPTLRTGLSGCAVGAEQVWDAMAGATELARPVPAAGAELADLVDWARAHAANGDGRCSVLFEILDDGGRAAHGEAPPSVPDDPSGRAGYRMFREAVGLVRRLRAAEADRAHGNWIFLRLETSATRYTVERCYDWWPAWMPRSPYAGPSVRALGREVLRRVPEYRPAWAELVVPAG